ncbi:MAG: short-chain dehydrogenase [Rhodobacterales bacterium]|nr:MAG: short-chain dehydrogenase [Rhodobacterales bacterium]
MARQLRKSHAPKSERSWQGHPFFSGGFRPFFLTSALFSILAVGLWLAELSGLSALNAPLPALDWHRHEMLFGYGSGVIAGFLFTAVPNWTGRLPVVGWPLIWFYILWLAGRASMLFATHIPYEIAALVDAVFLPILSIVIGREILVGKNWRNIKVLITVSVFGLANIWFHLQMVLEGSAAEATRLGFAAVLVLLMIIGGRIIPSFTRNWLARKNPPGKLPVPFNRYDNALERASAVVLLCWVFVDDIPAGGLKVLGLVFAALGMAHVARIWRWVGHRTVSNALLAVLHIFYLFVPAGFFVLAVGMLWEDYGIIIGALHVFGIGAMGGLTLAVMMRASLGHTGRKLATDRVMEAAMILLCFSVALRVIGAIWPEVDWAVTASGVSWMIGFGLFCLRIGPFLLLPRPSG